MLNQHYFYYVFKISETAIQSVLGLLAIAILIAAIFILIKFPRGAQFRLLSTNISILIAVILFSFAFSNAVYEFDEQPETLISELLPTGEPDCGTAWTGFRDTGNGIGRRLFRLSCGKLVSEKTTRQLKNLPTNTKCP